jgi:asparagine synthase (glutamine-hydrolysing)
MSEPVKTFSIGFEEDDYNELPYARLIVERFGTDHHEFLVKPNLISILPQLVWAFDEPFADPSMLPSFYVAQLARKQVTVVLTGDGGDEIFGGYKRYARELAFQQLSPLTRFVRGHSSALLPEIKRADEQSPTLHLTFPERYAAFEMLFPYGSRQALYAPEYFTHLRSHNPYKHLTKEFAPVAHLDAMTQMQYVDTRTYLTDDVLVKVDKTSMLNSLEARTPLLDQDLVTYVSSLPASIRTNNNILKYFLKKVANDVLPAELLVRPKQGFGVPIKHWFRNDLIPYARDILQPASIKQRGIFNPTYIDYLLKNHAATRTTNHSKGIWALLCLELWFQTYMDQ